MRQSTIYAFAYILNPQDGPEFSHLNRDNENTDAALESKDASLNQIEPENLSESQRLLLAAYLTMYALQTNSEESMNRIPVILDRLHVSAKYCGHVKNAFASLNRELVEQWGSPLAMVFTPSDEMVRFAASLVGFGLSHGECKYRCVLPGLNSQEYEHEMDRIFLDTLKKTKGFETLVRLFFKHGVERYFVIQHTGSNLQINSNQLSIIHEMIVDSCKNLNVSNLPDAYLEQGFINAKTIGSEKPLLVYGSACFGLLDYSEQMFITGHELGHIKSGHNLYSMIATLLSSGVADALMSATAVLTVGLSSALVIGIQVALFNWMRMSEFTADRAGLLCCQDIDAALRCLMKFAGMSPMFYSSMNVEAFKQQAREFRELDFSVRDKVIKTLAILDASHPWTVMRAHELLKWYESGEYQKVLNRITRQGTVPQNSHNQQLDKTEATCGFCPNCGHPQAVRANFCPKCGNKIG